MPKKIINRGGRSQSQEQLFSKLSPHEKAALKGVGNTKSFEPIPNRHQASNEHSLKGDTNAHITFGQDRPNSLLSGYGGLGDTQAASIDLCTGMMGSNPRTHDEKNRKLFADPDFTRDAARININQKTDIDKNFNIAPGKVGIAEARSAVAIKADGVRVVAREGIKLVTRTDFENSRGGKVKRVAGIDLIAGNDDERLQPIPRGTDLRTALNKMVAHINRLSGIVDAFMMAQSKYNNALMYHIHPILPYFNVPTGPSPQAIASGVQCIIEEVDQVKRSVYSHKINMANYSLNSFQPLGGKYINSPFNSTN